MIVVNQALNLPTGKLAAQVAHAAVGTFLAASHAAQVAWLEAGMPKIVVYGAHDAALLELEMIAQQRQIPNCIIRDAGRTVVRAGTITCVGLGPAPAASIDRLTGMLPLVQCQRPARDCIPDQLGPRVTAVRFMVSSTPGLGSSCTPITVRAGR